MSHWGNSVTLVPVAPYFTCLQMMNSSSKLFSTKKARFLWNFCSATTWYQDFFIINNCLVFFFKFASIYVFILIYFRTSTKILEHSYPNFLASTATNVILRMLEWWLWIIFFHLPLSYMKSTILKVPLIKEKYVSVYIFIFKLGTDI